jgi:hypothetical protein
VVGAFRERQSVKGQISKTLFTVFDGTLIQVLRREQLAVAYFANNLAICHEVLDEVHLVGVLLDTIRTKYNSGQLIVSKEGLWIFEHALQHVARDQSRATFVRYSKELRN